MGHQNSVQFPDDSKKLGSKKHTDMSFAKKMQEVEDSEIYDTVMDQRRR